MKYLFSIVIFLLIGVNSSNAQDIIKSVQPAIMIVPFKKSEEDYTNLIENNRDIRVAIGKLNEYFLARNFRTIDFLQKASSTSFSQALEAENQTSLEQQLAENNGADIIIYVDAEYIKGRDKYVDISLTAKDVYSSQVMSTASAQSRAGSFDDINLYMKNAIEKCAEEFLQTLNAQFSEVIKNGKSIKLSITVDQNSNVLLSSEIDGDIDTYADLIGDFLEENAHQNYMRCPISVDTKFECDDFRIPLRNKAKGNTNYKTSDFGRSLRRFLLKELGLYSSAKVIGNALYIDICGTESKCSQ